MTEPAAVMVPIASLAPWPGNPRHNDGAPVEAVVDSIRRFGFGSPILARRETGEIIAGHTRVKAARALGMIEVPVRYMDLDENEAHALALADNRIAELATWDDEGLASVMADLRDSGTEIGGLGWDEAGLAGILAAPEDLAGDTTGDDDVPAPPAVPVSRQGETYELGPHRLTCGDCRAPGVVSALLGGRLINVAFTSPPYASQRKYDETSGFKPIPPDEFVAWFEAVQGAVRANLAPDGSWFVNIKEHCEDGQRHLYVKDLTIAHVRRWGWMLVDELCWIRQGVPGGWPNRFKNGWEPIFHYSVERDIKFRPLAVGSETDSLFEYDPNTPKGPSGLLSGTAKNRKGAGRGIARPGNVVQASSGDAVSSSEHGATFPTALPEFFTKAYSDPGDAIFDPFMGSGTTLIAAAKNGRVAYGTEISPAYCDVIRRRWTRWALANNRDPGPGALEG